VKEYDVQFLPSAKADIIALYDYIADTSGTATAERYVDRIEATCLALSRFPQRGRSREDLWPGLRILGFEKRAVIAFVAGGRTVTIMRVLYGGRDFETILSVLKPS
jgi:toxin ParE1/3/4